MVDAGLSIDALDACLAEARAADVDAARDVLASLPDEPAREVLAGLLAQHAILAGDRDAADAVTKLLPRAVAIGYRAALHFVAGELRAGDALLDAVVAGPCPDLGAVAPILAILLVARDSPASTRAAKRLVGAGGSRTAKGAARALRKLIVYLHGRDDTHERIDVHRLGGAGPWELLLSALNVALHVHASATRASWAHVLVEKHAAWTREGYAWLGRQALLFARRIDPAQADKDVARLRLAAAGAPPSDPARSTELDLSSVIAPKPEWERTLEALANVARTIASSSEVSLRVAWYLEMSDGTFARPALQELRPGSGGWTEGQRTSVDELFEKIALLPPEDARVLEASRSDRGGRRLGAEAMEALVDHPRVFNGARGGTRVEVVRGVARVVVGEERGHVTARVEPDGMKAGVQARVESEARVVVYRVNESLAKVAAAMPRGARVPLARAADLSRVLDALGEGVEIESADRGAEHVLPADPTPCVRFSPHAGAWLVELGTYPFAGDARTTRGRFFVAGVGRPSLHFHREGGRIRIDRDLALERARADALVASCPTLAGTASRESAHAWILGEAEVLSLLSELAASTVAHELAWREDRLVLAGLLTRKKLGGRLRSVKGWYLATGGYRIRDVTEVALMELATAPVLAGGRFLRLPAGEWLEVEARVRRVLAALRQTGDRLPPAAIGALRELADPDSGFDVDDEARAWVERIESVSRVDAEVPAALAATLRPYQIDGFRWLARLSELGLGACLADDMGLGKTVQVIALLLLRSRSGAGSDAAAGEPRGPRGPHLVVAPTSVCSNWAREVARFAPSLRVVEYTGRSRAERLAADAGPGVLVIVSYAILAEDADVLASTRWDVVVLDEAQFIKNAETDRARAAFRLDASTRVALTGTPIENHLGDLWSVFHFLNPGLFGSWKDFQRRFVKPIERAADRAPEEELRAWIQPYVLRRMKEDVLEELPALTVLQHDVELSRDESVRYALLRKQIHHKLFTPEGRQGGRIEILAEITRLRRFCCHPRLVFPDADFESSKVTALLHLAEELRENGHRALVFSQYVDFLTIVREALDERGIAYEYLDGSTPEARRQARVDAFQTGDATLFLATLKAGGFGVNLTAADYVLHLDPWWNPAVIAQATDRAHRMGQSRPVTVYSLITKHTIEEQIVGLQQRKQRLAGAVLGGTDAAAHLSVDDLLRLVDDDWHTATQRDSRVST